MPVFEVDIRGTKYQIDAPDEGQAATQVLKLSQQPQHFDFNGSNIPGYDPATGNVKKDDLGKEYGTGIRQAIESTIGLPGDIGPMIGRGGSKLAELLGAEPDAQSNVGNVVSKMAAAAFNPASLLPYNNAASTQDIQENVTDPLLGPAGEPATWEGRAARTTGNFVGGAFAPGGIPRKILSMLAPAAGSEGAGELAHEYAPALEPYARFLGGLAGGAATVPKLGGKPIVEAAKDIGAKTKDLTRIIKRMQQDGMTPQQIQTRLGELGPDATLMDVGPNLRQEGQRIYAAGGRGRGIIDETLTPRDKGASARITGELDANLGPAPVPSQIDAGLKRTQRSLSPEYEKVLGNAKSVNTEAIANDIDSMIANSRGEAKTALEKVRGMLRIEGTETLDPHPRAALATRQAIDGMMAGTQDTNVRRILGDFRKRLDNEIGTSVPGIKAVDAKYANLAGQREAVERGQTVLDSGRTSPRPAELASEIAKGGPVIKGRLSQGARAEIDRIVGTNANDRVALQRIIKGEGDWNRDKLGQLFGKDRADRMISVLEREGTFADTSNRVMKNSATAERLPEGGSNISVRDAFGVGGPKAVAYSGLVKGVEAVMDKFRGAAAANRDERVARIIASTDAQKITTALLKANGGKRLPTDQIENAVRALLLTSGAKGQSAN